MNICVLGASFETPNMGVNALAVGTITCILHRWPDASVFLVDYRTEPCTYAVNIGDRTVPVPLVNIRFSKRLYLANNIAFLLTLAAIIRLIPFTAARKKLLSANACLSLLNSADMVTAISGGDSFSDIYGLGRLWYVALPQILTILLNNKLVLLPQTIGPFRRRTARIVARYILSRADRIYSRDHTGIAKLKIWLGDRIGKKLRFSYDVGFVLKPVKPDNAAIDGLHKARFRARTLIGLNVSGLLFGDHEADGPSFGLRLRYNELIFRVLDCVLSTPGVSVLLVPHVFGGGESSDTRACDAAYNAVNAKYGDRVVLLRGGYDEGEIKHVIGRCDFFIGSRMHACIAALSQCIPTVCIAYSDKFAGVMQTVGVGVTVVDPRTMGEESILASIGAAFQDRLSAKKRLEQEMPDIKDRVLALFADDQESCMPLLGVGQQECQDS